MREMMPDSMRSTAVRLVCRGILSVLASGAVHGVAAQQPVRKDAPPAALRLAHLFADGLVVQRGVPVRVWGWAAPHAAVTGTFPRAAARTVADTAGRWTMTFPATPAGGP